MRWRDLKDWVEHWTTTDPQGNSGLQRRRILVDYTAYSSPVGPGNDVPPFVHNMSDHDIGLYQSALDDGHINSDKLHLYWPSIWDESGAVLASRKSLGKPAYRPLDNGVHDVFGLYGGDLNLAGEDNEDLHEENSGVLTPKSIHPKKEKRTSSSTELTLGPSKLEYSFRKGEVRMPSIIHYGGVTREHRDILYQSQHKKTFRNPTMQHIIEQLKKHDSSKDPLESINSRPYDNKGLWKIKAKEDMWDDDQYRKLISRDPAFCGYTMSQEQAFRDDTPFSRFPKGEAAEGLSYLRRDEVGQEHMQLIVLDKESPVLLDPPTATNPFMRMTNNSLNATEFGESIGFTRSGRTTKSASASVAPKNGPATSTPARSLLSMTASLHGTGVQYSQVDLIDPQQINLQPGLTLASLYGADASYESDGEDEETAKGWINAKYESIKLLYRIFGDEAGKLNKAGQEVYVNHKDTLFATTKQIKYARTFYMEEEENQGEDEETGREDMFRKIHFMHQRIGILEARPLVKEQAQKPTKKRKFDPYGFDDE